MDNHNLPPALHFTHPEALLPAVEEGLGVVLKCLEYARGLVQNCVCETVDEPEKPIPQRAMQIPGQRWIEILRLSRQLEDEEERLRARIRVRSKNIIIFLPPVTIFFPPSPIVADGTVSPDRGEEEGPFSASVSA